MRDKYARGPENIQIFSYKLGTALLHILQLDLIKLTINTEKLVVSTHYPRYTVTLTDGWVPYRWVAYREDK